MYEPLIVLVGPTAVGKTSLSLPVAEALKAEIVNVDSRQLYRYMDIGTAKPTPEQQARVPHHLLDLLLPHQKTDAAQFVTVARQTIDQLLQRGRRVVVVAGSGLYLQALLYSLMPTPASSEALRQELYTYADDYGPYALHRRLQAIDPEAARVYHPHDRVRVVRAIEVTYLTGEPFSVHCRRHRHDRPYYPYVGFALTRERADLYARIAARTEDMLASGWLAEVKTLVAKGYTHHCAAMNSLGYRELLQYIAGQESWTETVAAIKRKTRRFAKRQLTWFRKFPAVCWYDLSVQRETEVVTQLLRSL